MKKVLWVGEASFLSTGYAVYGREVLKRLGQKYEVAELACYANMNDPRLTQIPWRVYPNLPSPEEENEYKSIPTNVFGEWKFEQVCMDFKPDYVCSLRDYWMDEFIARSPFRDRFTWLHMPTVDARDQNPQWIDTYSSADGLLTYQEWSKSVLEEESNGRCKVYAAAPPAASELFAPMPNRQELVDNLLGLSIKDSFVIGTVMRNQRRKLYPELFKAFRKILDKTKRKDIVLYCHTSYPDAGWDIPYYLNKYEVSNHVFFTYLCGENKNGQRLGCGKVFAAPFRDSITCCPQCGERSAGLPSVQRGVDDQLLAAIMNTFDAYVQYSNSEGFGMPMVEAAACGVPVFCTDYSAMEDSVRRLDGYPIDPIMLYTELETGCLRAYPDEDIFVDKMIDFIKLPEPLRMVKRKKTRDLYSNYYNWDTTAKAWDELIEKTPSSNRWDNPGSIHYAPPFNQHERINNSEFARWLVVHVLGDRGKVGSYMESRLIRDLNYGLALDGMAGLYHNEQSHGFSKPVYQPFSRKDAYDKMLTLCNRRNLWQQKLQKQLNV